MLLDADQRAELEHRLRISVGSKRDLVRIKALLLSDTSAMGHALTDEQVAMETGLSVRTIESLRRRFVENGCQSAISWRR